MKIQEKHIYHGTALTQIVEHPSFKALNKADDKYGHYRVNHDKNVFVKHCSSRRSPWQFNFQPPELKAIKNDIKSGTTVYLCLICGHNTVCTLTEDQIDILIYLDSEDQQNITIKVPKGGSMWAQGTKDKLERSIPHNSFPNIIFNSKEVG